MIIYLILAASIIIAIIVNKKSDENCKEEKNNNNNNSHAAFIIIILLIIIIILILNYNGFFYKFKVITENNINEITTSDKLNKDEKDKIMIKYFFNDKIVLNKTIYEVLK